MTSRKHRMTPKRRAALRKAQLASAKKRKKGSRRKKYIEAGILALGVGYAVVDYKLRQKAKKKTVYPQMGNLKTKRPYLNTHKSRLNRARIRQLKRR